MMVLGEHLEASTAAKYESVTVRYLSLAEVIGFCPLSDQIDWNGEKAEGATLTFRNPPTLGGRLGDFAIETAYGFRITGNEFQERTSEIGPWLSLTSATERHIDEFLKGPCKLLSQLLGMSIGHQPALAVVPATSKRNKVTSRSNHVPNPSCIVFAQRRSPLSLDIHPAEFPFTLAGLGNRFADILERWQMIAPVLTSSLDFFFSMDNDAAVALTGASHRPRRLNETTIVQSSAMSSSCLFSETMDYVEDLRTGFQAVPQGLERTTWMLIESQTNASF